MSVCIPLQQSSSNGFSDGQKVEGGCLSPEAAEELRLAEGKRVSRDPDTRSVSLLEQKRKVVSSSIDVPHARLVFVCEHAKSLKSVSVSFPFLD